MKRLLSLLLAVLFVTALVPAVVSGEESLFDGGRGTHHDPYRIATVEQLTALARSVNDGTAYEGVCFRLDADIVLNDTTGWEDWKTNPPANDWEPIGTGEAPFKGCFNGNGHTISGLYVSDTNYGNSGLFGYVQNAIIADVTVAGAYHTDGHTIGGIVGVADASRVLNCRHTGKQWVNGIYNRAGGIVGYACNGTVVAGCESDGAIEALGDDVYLGGIVGQSENATIEDCRSDTDIHGESIMIIAGVNAGGIVGNARSTDIRRCGNTATLTTFDDDQSNNDTVGGIVGTAVYVTIEDCYHLGTLGSEGNVAGIVAWLCESTVRASYSASSVASGYSKLGGITSFAFEKGTVVVDCYYQNGVAVDTYGTALTAAQMQDSDCYAGFDFESVWVMDATVSAYPTLGTPETDDTLVGDADGNHAINMMDVMQVYAVVSGQAAVVESARAATDVNRDGQLNMQDVMVLYSLVSGQ